MTGRANPISRQPGLGEYPCRGCGLIKPEAEFYSRARASGRSAVDNRCKACRRLASRNNRPVRRLAGSAEPRSLSELAASVKSSPWTRWLTRSM